MIGQSHSMRRDFCKSPRLRTEHRLAPATAATGAAQKRARHEARAWSLGSTGDKAFRMSFGFGACCSFSPPYRSPMPCSAEHKRTELWHDTGRQDRAWRADLSGTRAQISPTCIRRAAALLLAPPSALFRQAGALSSPWSSWYRGRMASRASSCRCDSPPANGGGSPCWFISSRAYSSSFTSGAISHLGQPSLVLLALLLGAFVALQEKRNLLAGSLIALAAAIKAFPS